MKFWLRPPGHPAVSSIRFFVSTLLTASAVALGLGGTAQALDFTLADDATVVAKWDQAMLQAIGDTEGFGPTPTSRALGVVHTSIFDAWAAYDPVAIGTQLGDQLQVPPDQITLANKQEAISYAAYTTLVDLFPGQENRFRRLMQDLGYDPNFQTADTTTSAGIGLASAQAVINLRRQDGSNQAGQYADISGYQPVNSPDRVVDPNRWQPLRVSQGTEVQTFLTPHWGNVQPFALASGDQFLPPESPPFGTEAYRALALEVLEFTADLDDRQKVIAEYWADGPGTVQPAGHWHLFGQFVSQRDNHTLDEDVQMFFILGNAVMDAGISAWYSKVFYDFVRPITTLQYLADNNMLPNNHPYVQTNPNTGVQEVFSWAGPNQGNQWIEGAQWTPYQATGFVSPAFAEYVSGHSAFSTAAAEVLQRFTGSDRFGGQHTQAPRSSNYESVTPQQEVVLQWNTFSDAASESGISRLYGGIHFQPGNLNGQRMGRLVGRQVWERAQFYIQGGQPIVQQSFPPVANGTGLPPVPSDPNQRLF